MRRAVARGRILPQSLSTDPRMGRVSLKAALLFPLMWINCDDQGRISGDPDEVKYATCPNIDGIYITFSLRCGSRPNRGSITIVC